MNPVDELDAIRVRLGITQPLPALSKEHLEAVEHNRKINIERYGDPMGYLFDYSDEDDDKDMNNKDMNNKDKSGNNE